MRLPNDSPGLQPNSVGPWTGCQIVCALSTETGGVPLPQQQADNELVQACRSGSDRFDEETLEPGDPLNSGVPPFLDGVGRDIQRDRPRPSPFCSDSLALEASP